MTTRRASKATGFCVLTSGLAWFCCVPIAAIGSTNPPAGASASTTRPAIQQKASPAKASQPSSAENSSAMDENSRDLRNLIEQVAASETLLKNVRVTGTAKTENLSVDGTWQPRSSATVTDTYINEPGGKFRDERDEVSPWVDGPASTCQEVSITTFDGRSKQVLTLKSGIPDDHRKQPLRGAMEAERGVPLGSHASGWAYSLYGNQDNTFSQRLSTYLDFLAGRKNMQILVSRVPQGSSFYLQMTASLNGHKTEVWSFDPDHGYAIRRYERWSQDGKITKSFTVNKLVEAAPGVFYPTDVTDIKTWPADIRAVMRSLGPQTRSHVQISSVTANIPDLSDNVFSIQWPEGTRVEDKVAGTTFVVKKEQ